MLAMSRASTSLLRRHLVQTSLGVSFGPRACPVPRVRLASGPSAPPSAFRAARYATAAPPPPERGEEEEHQQRERRSEGAGGRTSDDAADEHELSPAELRRRRAEDAVAHRTAPRRTKEEILATNKFAAKRRRLVEERAREDPVEKAVDASLDSAFDRFMMKTGNHPMQLDKTFDASYNPDGTQAVVESDEYLSEGEKRSRAEWREYWRKQSARYLRRMHRVEDRRLADAKGYKSMDDAAKEGFQYSKKALGEGKATLPEHSAPNDRQRYYHAFVSALTIGMAFWFAFIYEWGDDENLFAQLRRWVGIAPPRREHGAKAVGGDGQPPGDDYEPRFDLNESLAKNGILVPNLSAQEAVMRPLPTFEDQVQKARVSLFGTPFTKEEMARATSILRPDGEDPQVYQYDTGLTDEQTEAFIKEMLREADMDERRAESANIVERIYDKVHDMFAPKHELTQIRNIKGLYGATNAMEEWEKIREVAHLDNDVANLNAARSDARSGARADDRAPSPETPSPPSHAPEVGGTQSRRSWLRPWTWGRASA